MCRFARLMLLLVLLVAVVSLACNLPQAQPPNMSLTNTVAFMTVLARVSQAGITPSLPAATVSPVVFTSTVAPLPSNCDQATFVTETIPDGTVVSPGSTFVKTWTIKNSGSCTWGTGYALVFDSGVSMGAAETPLPSVVQPGQTVTVSISLTAPLNSGDQKGNYKLKNASGARFGIGKNASDPFWVLVSVSNDFATGISNTPVPSATVSGADFVNLIDYAAAADWKSCEIPCSAANTLAFTGSETSPSGYVVYRYNATLENGQQYPRVLETHPPFADNGTIYGIYQEIDIKASYHFKSLIGFTKGSGNTCSSADANFQVGILEIDKFKNLGSWRETCDGTLTSINLDLSGMAGKSIRLVLFVISNGSSSKDTAVWIDTRIEP